MVWLVVILSCLWSGLLPVSSRADHLSGGEIASPGPKLPPVAGIPYADAGLIVERHREELMRLPGVYIVTVGDGGLILGVLIPSQDRTVNPEALQAVTKNLPTVVEGLPVKVKPLPVLPPPPGVIVLQPGGIREQADSCPVGFVEVPRLGWRFCVDPGKPESIPPLMEPPIA